MVSITPKENIDLLRVRLFGDAHDTTVKVNPENKLQELPFLWPENARPILRIDNSRDGLVFTLRQADPELVRELLRFMMHKKWLTPTSGIDGFLDSEEKDFTMKEETVPVEFFNKPKIRPNRKNAFLNTKNEFLKAVNKVIEERLDDENFRPDHLARKMFICQMQLHRKLKKLARLSPSNYIRKYRLIRSRSFLKMADLSISEVSYLVGFRSLEYYSRSFKKEFGFSPSQFRKYVQIV